MLARSSRITFWRPIYKLTRGRPLSGQKSEPVCARDAISQLLYKIKQRTPFRATRRARYERRREGLRHLAGRVTKKSSRCESRVERYRVTCCLPVKNSLTHLAATFEREIRESRLIYEIDFKPRDHASVISGSQRG